jgi:uncharacterized protein (TIGR02246 family)
MTMWNPFSLAVVAPVLAACTGNQAPGLSQRNMDAIHAVQDKYVSTVLAGDWDAWITTLTADAVFMPFNQPPIKSRDAIAAWVRTIPKTTAFRLLDNEIAGAGDVAYAVGTFTVTSSADGVDTSFNGARSEAYRRQADGSWRMSRVIFHPTGPVASAVDYSANESAIRAMVKEAEAYFNTRNFAAYAAMYIPDGDLIIGDSARHIGRENVKRALDEGWKTQPASCRVILNIDEVRMLSADVAFVEANGDFPGCKEISPNRGTTTLVRRDGEWQIAALRIYHAARGK